MSLPPPTNKDLEIEVKMPTDVIDLPVEVDL
jgi:hypothetical protein